MEEVLPSLQQAPGAQGDEVNGRRGRSAKPALAHDIVLPQVTQLSIGVIGLSLFIGLVIWLLDLVFGFALVRVLPSLFGG